MTRTAEEFVRYAWQAAQGGILCAVLSVLGAAAIAQETGGEGTILGPQARALIIARDEAVLSAEITARITEMPVRPGARFDEGDRLVRFGCARYAAQRDVAQADLAAAEKSLESLEKLLSLNAAGPLEVEVARAQRDRAQAQLRLYQADVNLCSLRAPYAGRVVSWIGNPHEFANTGDELIEIVADKTLEIEMIVPSAWLRWLAPGMALSLSVDETGEAYAATLSAVGATVDPVSQTVRIRAVLDSTPDDLIPGMSGTAIFPQAPVR